MTRSSAGSIRMAKSLISAGAKSPEGRYPGLTGMISSLNPVGFSPLERCPANPSGTTNVLTSIGVTPSAGDSADPVRFANLPVFIGMTPLEWRPADPTGAANSAIFVGTTPGPSQKGQKTQSNFDVYDLLGFALIKACLDDMSANTDYFFDETTLHVRVTTLHRRVNTACLSTPNRLLCTLE